MGKNSRPKTPAHEKLQAQTAAAMFDRGHAIKGNISNASLGDHRYDGRGLAESTANAAAAAGNRNALVMQRRRQGMKVASSSAPRNDLSLALTKTIGKPRTREGATRQISTRLGSLNFNSRIVSDMQNKQTLIDNDRKTTRNQMLLDSVVAGGLAYARFGDHSEKKFNMQGDGISTRGPNWGGGVVPQTGPRDIANPYRYT